jgi:cell division protein ZipA
VNVIAKKGQVIDGQALLDAVQSFGLRFGDMDIFHRHENASGHGPVIFSMANAINPGTFNIDDLPDMQVRGVTFFMRLSTINKRIFVLELMVDIAKRLSNQLGAELKDDTHSVLSSQTVAHYKTRIQEYERRYLGQVLRK